MELLTVAFGAYLIWNGITVRRCNVELDAPEPEPEPPITLSIVHPVAPVPEPKTKPVQWYWRAAIAALGVGLIVYGFLQKSG
jgi:hypothetical protein